MKKTLGMILASAVATAPLLAEEAPAKEQTGPQFSVAGEVEFEANTHFKQVDPRDGVSDNGNDKKWLHDYSSTFNLVFSVKFNEKWSAEAGISADDANFAPSFAYDGAFIQYQMNDNIAIKAGDFTYSEGAFRYYDYDDPGDAAVGMTERNIRGIELNAYGLVLGAGWGTDDDDCIDVYSDSGEEVGCKSYDVHVAYELALGSHTIRPFVNYQSYQQESANRLRAGVTANLVFGEVVNVQVAYGLLSDIVKEDEPKMSHAFAIEPEFNLGKLNVKGTAFYAYKADEKDVPTEIEVPEYMFAYVEPSFAVNDQFTVGVQGEYHTMSTNKDDELSQVFVGPKAYFSPMENLSVEGYFRACIPVGDDYKKDSGSAYAGQDDVYFGAGATVGFTF